MIVVDDAERACFRRLADGKKTALVHQDQGYKSKGGDQQDHPNTGNNASEWNDIDLDQDVANSIKSESDRSIEAARCSRTIRWISTSRFAGWSTWQCVYSSPISTTGIPRSPQRCPPTHPLHRPKRHNGGLRLRPTHDPNLELIDLDGKLQVGASILRIGSPADAQLE